MLSEKTKQKILELQKKYPEKRSALLPALHVAQSEKGFLPKEIQAEVAELFELSPSDVHSVVSFYDMFFEEPVGKHVIHVCKNISCMLRGSDALLSTLCTKLKVLPHEMTSDGEFTVIPCECLAACDRAPMMMVDAEVIGPVALDEIDAILENAKKKKGHHCPVPQEEDTHE